MVPAYRPLPDRFMEKFIPEPNSGCWLWTAYVDGWGYGVIKVGRKTCKAHRVSYELHVGAVADGMIVCHRCDTPACVNPDHLWLGTHADNSWDCSQKGRRNTPKGSANVRALFTESQVEAIRRDRRPARVIAAEYGASRRTIYAIRQRESWRHVK